ncbi:MAG: hypothetical protein ACKVOK_04320 [Flavobacteriales bacterium]
MSIKNYLLLVLLYTATHSINAQRFYAGTGIENKWTVEQSVYKTITGFGPCAWVRYKPFKFAYIQTGGALSFIIPNDERLKRHRMHSVDFKLGFTPIQKYPVSITIGSVLHFYKYTTEAAYYQDLLFLPELTLARKMDGVSIGASYPIKKWLEVSVTFEKEPFMLWYHPRNANYLTFQVSAMLGLVKSESAKM